MKLADGNRVHGIPRASQPEQVLGAARANIKGVTSLTSCSLIYTVQVLIIGS